MYLAIKRLSPKMPDTLVNAPHSPGVSQATGQVYLLACVEAPRTPFVAFERSHLTSVPLAHTNVGHLASGLILSHNIQVCLVYLQARP